VFRASSEPEMRNWIEALQSAMRGIRKRHSSKHVKTQEELKAATLAAESELNAAIPADNPLSVNTRQRPRAPPGRKLPARARRARPSDLELASQGNSPAATIDPSLTASQITSAHTSPNCTSSRRLSSSALCGQSLDSVGSLSFRSGKCSHDSGLGVDTPNALEDRPGAASLTSDQLNAIELAARLSNELLNRTHSASPSCLPSTVRHSVVRARSNSLDLLDRPDSEWSALTSSARTAKAPFGGSVDAIDGSLACTRTDEEGHDDKAKSNGKRLGVCSRRKRLLFFLRPKHKCKSLNELANSTNPSLISSTKLSKPIESPVTNVAVKADQGQVGLPIDSSTTPIRSFALKVNRSKFYVQLQSTDAEEDTIEHASHYRSRSTDENVIEMKVDDDCSNDTTSDRLVQNTQTLLTSIHDHREDEGVVGQSNRKDEDRASDTIESTSAEQIEEDSDVDSSSSVEVNQANSTQEDFESNGDFRQQFLQRKALFESQGKRHSLDLLDQRSSLVANHHHDLAVRPKSYGEAH
jgi:hypothetical protein